MDMYLRLTELLIKFFTRKCAVLRLLTSIKLEQFERIPPHEVVPACLVTNDEALKACKIKLNLKANISNTTTST